MVYILTTNLPLPTIKIKKTNPYLSISPLLTEKLKNPNLIGKDSDNPLVKTKLKNNGIQ